MPAAEPKRTCLHQTLHIIPFILSYPSSYSLMQSPEGALPPMLTADEHSHLRLLLHSRSSDSQYRAMIFCLAEPGASFIPALYAWPVQASAPVQGTPQMRTMRGLRCWKNLVTILYRCTYSLPKPRDCITLNRMASKWSCIVSQASVAM